MEIKEFSAKSLNNYSQYLKTFKKMLLEMRYDDKSIKILAVTDEFEHNYRSKSPIWWYTREFFIYQMLNRALRTLESDTTIHMNVFIRNLHQQITGQ
jgi:hypothetical protein